MINSKIKNDNFINLDYNKIRNEINGNIESNIKTVKPKRIYFNKALYMSLSIFVLFGITLFSTIFTCKKYIIANHESHSSNCAICNKQDPGVSEPGGEQGLISSSKVSFESMMLKEYDLCVAFSGRYAAGTNYIPLSKILLTDLLKEEDKNELINEFNLKKDVLDYSVYCNFYLIIDNQKDYVFIKQLNGEFKEFIFESNLSYDFTCVIDEFETLSNVTLTKEWLNDNEYDTMGNLTTGISIYFTEIEPGVYKEYYTAIIYNKMYVINK